MPLVGAVYAPNAPNLIAPEAFGGSGGDTVHDLRALDLVAKLRPDRILVATPHWVSRSRFLVHEGDRPRQLYDFTGLPPQVSSIRYEPRGDPALAARLVARGRERQIPVGGTTEWGLDHGAWAALLHLSPGAAVPVVPLSITAGTPREHMAWGEAIGSVLAETEHRVLFVSTGSITHSFSRMQTSAGRPWPEGEQMEKEVVDLMLQREYEKVADFDPRKWGLLEPEGNLSPFFVMAGAMGKSFAPRLISSHQIWGAFGLTILTFDPP
ncbi:MAG: dioxygenase [Thermoplasmata archaeon]|nr:dioxygenase [Thermoplasmata archaeon]